MPPAEEPVDPATDRWLGRWLASSQLGDHDRRSNAARDLLEGDLPAQLRVKLLIVLAVAEYSAGRMDEAALVATRYVQVADELDSPGCRAEALAMRAGARWELADTSGAVDDLIEAEVALARCQDSVTAVGAHQSLGNTYSELRFFELAEPHFESAIAGDRRTGHQGASRVVDRLNLAVLHFRWAQHLRWTGGSAIGPDERRHLLAAADLLHQAEVHGGGPDHPYWPMITAARRRVDAALDPAAALPSLLEQRSNPPEPTNDNDRVLLDVLLARVLREVGDPGALGAARKAVARAQEPGVMRSTWIEAMQELHLVEVTTGVEGADGAGGYVRIVISELARQRDDSQESLRARRDFALLQDRHHRTSQLAQEDPLTAVGNRRALDAWLAHHPLGPAGLVMVDLDGFKNINDEYGHEAGDAVLVDVASALRSTAGPGDLVVRYGGDEFVLATTAPHRQLGRLVERISAAISHLPTDGIGLDRAITATIGASAAADGESTMVTLQRADRLMLAAKAERPAVTSPRLSAARDRRRQV